MEAKQRATGFMLAESGSVAFIASSACWLRLGSCLLFSRLGGAAALFDVHEVRPSDVPFFGDVIACSVGVYIYYVLRYLSWKSLSSITLLYSNWTCSNIAGKRERNIGKRNFSSYGYSSRLSSGYSTSFIRRTSVISLWWSTSIRWPCGASIYPPLRYTRLEASSNKIQFP
jgi:hypothetical protein